jgi:hypothetical protein
VADDFKKQVEQLEQAIHLGIDVEGDEPSMRSHSIPPGHLSDDQINWLAWWLASEGFNR